MNYETELTVDKRILNAIKFGVQQAVPRGREHLYTEPELIHVGTGHTMVARLERYVYGEEVKRETASVTLEFTHPATWWDMFKRDVLPDWLRGWFLGVNYTAETKTGTVAMSTVALLPDYVPPHGTGPTVTIHEMRTPDFLVSR